MTLKVDIFTQNLELTERLSDYVNKKAVRLDRFLKDIDETRVDLSYVKSARNESDRQVAQITIRGKGFILRSEERANDLFTAIDAAIDKIERQIERFKGKRERGRTGAGEEVKAVEIPQIEEEGAKHAFIARRKKFALPPMDENEALDQMILLGHDNFFIFFNINTNAINVLYKRRDGSYGLIEPTVG